GLLPAEADRMLNSKGRDVDSVRAKKAWALWPGRNSVRRRTGRERVVREAASSGLHGGLAGTAEALRLAEAQQQRGKHWRRWGPYLSERQWGTVREDYSEH